jgi:hypothetical protein
MRATWSDQLHPLQTRVPVPFHDDVVPAEQAVARTSAVEADSGAKINPAYLSLRRVEVEKFSESNTTMAAVPENLDVKIGDVVELNSRYRDPSLPCPYIPWTIGRLVDHAPQ